MVTEPAVVVEEESSAVESSSAGKAPAEVGQEVDQRLFLHRASVVTFSRSSVDIQVRFSAPAASAALLLHQEIGCVGIQMYLMIVR